MFILTLAIDLYSIGLRFESVRERQKSIKLIVSKNSFFKLFRTFSIQSTNIEVIVLFVYWSENYLKIGTNANLIKSLREIPLADVFFMSFFSGSSSS